MSYSKLVVHYTTDGFFTIAAGTAGKVKKKTITLPKKVQEYGDSHGYSSISISYRLDHIILEGGNETLMDLDIINGTNYLESITSIVSTEWIR